MDHKEKSEEYWKEKLTPEEYHILREKGTEAAFSGELLDNKGKGKYTCKACKAELFSSEDKFDSGSGWPSFTKPFSAEAVQEEPDESFGIKQTEVLCSRCGGHLGHVFPDGPPETGLRYCINSKALDFKEQ